MNALTSSQAPAGTEPRRPRLSLLTQAALATAVVMAIAAILLTLTPVEIHAPITTGQLALVLGGITVLFVTNLVLLWRVLRPVGRLTDLMSRIDPDLPGQRIAVGSEATEITALTEAFNAMLDRLERERRESGRIALAAQEAERRRVAAELHDEIGQTLTAAAIQIEHSADQESQSPEDLRRLAGVVRESLADVRRIARELRPEALDDLGLTSALIALCNRVGSQGQLRVKRDLHPVSGLDPEVELVIYRVVQESLTNVVRHSRATEVEVTLESADGLVRVVVADNGIGMPAGAAGRGVGIAGMRERARLVYGSLVVESRPGEGTTVRLEIPVQGGGDAGPA